MISKVPKVGADAAMHSFSVFMQSVSSTAVICCSSDTTVFVSVVILGKGRTGDSIWSHSGSCTLILEFFGLTSIEHALSLA